MDADRAAAQPVSTPLLRPRPVAGRAGRARARHLPPHRRDLSGDRRAGRLAHPVARAGVHLSPASIRNTMQDLTQLGLLGAPHTQRRADADPRGPAAVRRRPAGGRRRRRGRAARHRGAAARPRPQLRGGAERGQRHPVRPGRRGRRRGHARCATPGVKHVEFVALGVDQALAVMVFDDGTVENRLMPLPAGVTPSALQEASNFLNARLRGRTLAEAARRDARRAGRAPGASWTPPPRGWSRTAWPPGAAARRTRAGPDRARPRQPAAGRRAPPRTWSGCARCSTTWSRRNS